LDPFSLFWYILMLMMLVSFILRLLHERRMRQLRIEEPKVVTTLRCCVTIKRDFKPGNHILGHGEPCPKCQKPMLIEAIYRVPPLKAYYVEISLALNKVFRTA